jgi:predicted transcriptional regulator
MSQTHSEEKSMSSSRKYKVMADMIRISVPVINESVKPNPLDSIQVLVFGYLVYRSRKNKSASRTAIGRSLRLDRSAVRRAICSLGGLGLVREDEKGLLVALEPTGANRQYFRFRKKVASEWQGSFVFDRVFLPCSSRTLSVRTNALFWRLYKWGVPVDSMPGYLQVGGHPDCPIPYLKMQFLVNGLGCHRTTISNAVKRLVGLGLIKIFPMEDQQFAVGIPPLQKHVGLWRGKWQKSQTPITVTAQQLFGVPSSAPVTPARPQPSDGLAADMTASHIPPKLADQIMEVIEKHDIPKEACRRMLTRAASKHAENREGTPGALEHCGYLFKRMVEDWGRAESKRQEITAVHRSPSYEEVMAEEATREMRFTAGAERLLRCAVKSESLDLDDGGVVPCLLNWEAVYAVHKKTKGDFVRFKEDIARSIFTFEDGEPPHCRWYELWMAATQIPLPDNEPLIACGVQRSDLRDIRGRVDDWASIFIDGKTECIEYGDTFVWLASLQAREKSLGAILDAMELLARQVRGERLFPALEDSKQTAGHLVFRRW